MLKKFVLSFVLILLMSSVAVNAAYYYERTSTSSSDGSSFNHEIEFRGTIGPRYSEDYDRYYDGRTRRCSRRDARRSYTNRYYGRGYSTNCYDRYYRYSYRPIRYTTTYNRYAESPRYDIVARNERTSVYNYRGRTITRTSRY